MKDSNFPIMSIKLVNELSKDIEETFKAWVESKITDKKFAVEMHEDIKNFRNEIKLHT